MVDKQSTVLRKCQRCSEALRGILATGLCHLKEDVSFICMFLYIHYGVEGLLQPPLLSIGVTVQVFK